MELSEKIITDLINIKQEQLNFKEKTSTIVLALKGARFLSGRNPYNAKENISAVMDIDMNFLKMYDSLKNSGLINYLIFLEQIGSVFKIKDYDEEIEKELQGVRGIERALKLFLDNFEDKKIDSICNLRNSLVHRFGLSTKRYKSEKFILSEEKSDIVVKLPQQKYKMEEIYSNKEEVMMTTIYVNNLIDKIEEVFSNIVLHFSNNNLDLSVEKDEVLSRFFIEH